MSGRGGNQGENPRATHASHRQVFAYAMVAGVNPVYGLYTGMVITIAASLTLSSSLMMVTLTNALALVTADPLGALGSDVDPIRAMFTLTLLTGAIMFLLGLLRIYNEHRGSEMGNAIGSILPQAIGVAISPIPIIAVILMLFSKRAKSNGLAFLAGWVLALAIVGSVVLVLAGAGKVSAGGTPSTLSYAVHLLLGLLLLFLAYRNWQKRPREGEAPEMPKWMATIDSFTAGRAFGLSALLAGVNPKNLALTLAAALSIAQAGLKGAQPWIVLFVFVLLASVSVAAPVLCYLIAGRSAEKMLNNWKVWLTANNATVMMVLLLVLGVKLVGDGLGGLFG